MFPTMHRTVFGPFKKFWKETTTSFLAETACPVTHANFFRLVTRAWDRIKPDYLINGFRATGIFPWDPSVIPNEAYLPSAVYTGNTEGKCNDGSEQRTCPSQSSEERPVSKITSMPYQSETVSVNISDIPQITLGDHTEGTLVDLGISITDNGVIMSSAPFDVNLDRDLTAVSDTIIQDPLPIASSSDACPPELALAAIECSISQTKIAQYEKALSAGRDVADDPTFQAWKTNKVKTCPQIPPPSDTWLLDVPSVPLPTKKSKCSRNSSYFVISCDKAFREKQVAEMEKIARLEGKKARVAKKLAVKSGPSVRK